MQVYSASAGGANASGLNTSTTIQPSELTSTFDIVKGLVAGDKIDVGNANLASVAATGTTTTLLLANANLSSGVAAGTEDSAVFARGTYDSAAGTFAYAANGADSALTYDALAGAGTQFETIILVGYVPASTTTVAAGIITLA